MTVCSGRACVSVRVIHSSSREEVGRRGDVYWYAAGLAACERRASTCVRAPVGMSDRGDDAADTRGSHAAQPAARRTYGGEAGTKDQLSVAHFAAGRRSQQLRVEAGLPIQ